MTHLRIEQNTSSNEYVASDIIHKLYETAKCILDTEEANNVQESQVSLKGSLYTTACYRSEKQYLESKFPDLHITTDDYIVKFEDNVVENKLLSLYGVDGIITESRAASISQPTASDMFKNTSAVSFNELPLFTNWRIIKTGMFYQVSTLREIDLSSVIGVDSGAFNGCTSLTNLGDTGNITWIAQNGFRGCTALSSIDTSNITSIGSSAFQGCTALTTCIWPTSVTTIPVSCFSGCTNLESLGSKISPTQVNNLAFKDCNKLTQDDINLSSIVTIGTEAFKNSGISGVVNLTNCTYIGTGAFDDCAVTEIHAPNLTLGSGTFRNITVFDAPKLGGVSPSFESNTNLTTLILDFDNIIEIPNWGWDNCTSLTGTFDFAKLQKVGAKAFNNGHYNIVIRRTEAVCEFINWGDQFGTFSGTIYVPDSLLSAYRSHAEWSKVPNPTNQIKGISELPST